MISAQRPGSAPASPAIHNPPPDASGCPRADVPGTLLSGALAPALFTIGLSAVAGLAGTQILAPALGWGRGGAAAAGAADTWPGWFARWDSGYYLQIAQGGYAADGAERAFFPLYPALARLLALGPGVTILWAGWLISVAAFLGAATLLMRLLRCDHDAHVASRAVRWLCCGPTAFFFVAFYPESLFLLLQIAALYLARRGHFLACGGAIALAGATRPQAFLLVIPFMVEFALQRDFRWSRWLGWLGGAALAPLGAGAYLLFLGYQAGGASPLAVYGEVNARNWGTTITWPWMSLARGGAVAIWGTGIGAGDWFLRAVAWQDLLATLLGLGLAVWSFRLLRLSHSLLLLAGMLFFISSSHPAPYVFESMSRHVASFAPVYPMLALAQGRLPPRLRWVPPALSGALLGLLAAWFASGRWVA